MKIQCDVCDKDEASVFCVADEAALCATCDHRVHHANKLAGKHQRFSLHQPSSSKYQLPLCDICRERRAFLFCQQDRAILCRDCDVPIHKANEHTQKHTRYLLTGVKLSATATVYSDASSCSSESESSNLANNSSNASDSVSGVVMNQKGAPFTAKGTSGQSTVVATVSGSCQKSSSTSNVEVNVGGLDLSSNGGGSVLTTSSTISEYLIEMLPGWHVEDFLDSSLSSTYGFFKNGENDVLPLWDGDLETNMGAFNAEKMGCWVPQVQPTLHQATPHENQSAEMVFGSSQNGLIRDQQQHSSKQFAAANNGNIKSNRKWSDLDNSFAVPQISSPPSSNNSFKRSRTFW